MRKKSVSSVVLATCLAGSGTAMAEDGFKVSGYGTLGVVRTNTNEAEFASTVTAPNGAKSSWNAGVDSRLGVQADWIAGDWSATAQAVTLKNGEGNFRPQVVAANVKYRMTPALEVRLGRIAMPIYAISDYRNVGYAYTWVRPPLEVYYSLPYNSLDGLSALYRTKVGDGTFRFEPFYGRNKGFWYFGSQGDGDPIKGFHVGYEIGNWDLRAMALKINVIYSSPGLDGIFNGMRSTSIPSVVGLANRLTTAEGKKCAFNSLGATYDNGTLLYSGEYVNGPCDSFIAGIYGWTHTVGYRIGKFMPYFVFSSQIPKRKHDADLLPNTPEMAGFRGALNAIETGTFQRSMVLGLRWDVYQNMALKAQVDHIQTRKDEPSIFVNAAPGFAGKSVNVYSVALDFVF